MRSKNGLDSVWTEGVSTAPSGAVSIGSSSPTPETPRGNAAGSLPGADPLWVTKFRYRLEDFEATTCKTGVACSIKWRTIDGRFDRMSSPAAYKLIEACVRRSGAPGRWVEVHSNGPELLIYLTVTPDGFAVGEDVVALLTEMACARAEGIRQGDRADEPLELIVRRFDERGRYVEQVLMGLASGERTTAAAITLALQSHSIAVIAS